MLKNILKILYKIFYYMEEAVGGGETRPSELSKSGCEKRKKDEELVKV